MTYDYVWMVLFEQSFALIGVCCGLVSECVLLSDRCIPTFCIPCVDDRVLVLRVRNHTTNKTLRSLGGVVDCAKLERS